MRIAAQHGMLNNRPVKLKGFSCQAFRYSVRARRRDRMYLSVNVLNSRKTPHLIMENRVHRSTILAVTGLFASSFLPTVNAQDRSTTAEKPVLLNAQTPVTIQDDGRALDIHCNGKQIATYVYRHDKVLRPFFAHVKSPSGTQVTRNFPPRPEDRSDHDTMHPGLWMAFGDISGEDFWRNKGRVVHKRFTEAPTVGHGAAHFVQQKSYQRGDGSVVCTEEFRCTVRVLPEGYLLEWDSTFTAPEGGEFYFGDQEEMGLGIRVATPISELEGGQIRDSEGRQGARAIWSHSSDWCDYSGKVGEQALGITILCHPDNFRSSWMHARNYGLIAANAFGRKAMQKGVASRLVIKDGKPFRIRYGIFLHNDVTSLDAVHASYVKIPSSRSSSDRKP